MVFFTLSNVIVAGRADGGAAKVREALERARELAATNRTDVEVVFTNDNRLVIQRINWNTSPFARVRVDEYILENGVTFKLFSGITQDTPNTFGRAAAVTFASRTVGSLTGPTITFTSEGSSVDASGDPVNGTIFMGLGERVETARAITIMGATAGVQTWKWQGSAWTD